MRPTRQELEDLVEQGTYEQHVRSAMEDFCFTITRHEGKQRAWFGDWSVTVNRNVGFDFFPRDARDDPGLEPYPVMRGERYQVLDLRPDPDTPDYVVTTFHLDAAEYRAAVESMEEIRQECGDLRLLPDAYFADTAIVKLLQRLLQHPKVKEERAADWPPLLK